MTDLTHRDALSWCLVLALGLCLVALGVALSVNLASTILQEYPDTIYPVGGPLAGLAGGLCLAISFGSRRLSQTMAVSLLLLSVLLMPLALANTSVTVIDMPRVGILPGLPAAMTVLCIGHFMATRDAASTQAIRTIAGVTAAVGLVNLFLVGPGLPDWARLTTVPDLNPATALFLIIGSAGLLLVPRVYRNSYSAYRRPVLWVAIFGIMIVVAGWYLIRENHQRDREQQAELIASQTSDSIVDFYRDELALIGRLAERIQTAGARLTGQTWNQEVTSYFRDFPHLKTLALLDDRQGILRLDSREFETRVWLNQHFESTDFRSWIENVRLDPSPHPSHVVEGPDRELLAFVAAPVETNPDHRWTVLALSDLDRALRWLSYRQTGDLVIEVKSGDQTLFQTRNLAPGERRIRARQEIELHPGVSWTLTVSEPLKQREAAGSLAETLILFGGLALTILVMLSRLFSVMAVTRNQHLHQANGQLQEHLLREQELREVNERIVNFSSDLLCTIDQWGCFRFVSPSSKRILGYAPDEMEGRPASDFVLEEDWKSSIIAASQVRIQQAHTTPQFRNRYRHRDGHVVTLDWKARAPVDESNLFCIGRDMTMELKAEALTQQREAFFSLTPEMFCIVSENRFVEVNEAFLTSLGYSRTDLQSRPYLNIIHPAYHTAVTEAVEQLFRGRTVYELEIEALHEDGGRRWLRLNASMHKALIYCSARDITREKEVLRALREKEHLLNMAEETGRLGGWIVDVASGKSTWSSAVCDIHELAPGEIPTVEEAIGFYTPEHRPRVEQSVRLAMELGLPFDIEARIRTATGRLRWVRAIGEAVRNEQGEIVTLQGAFQDISASKEASEQIRRLAERQSRIFESITDAFFTVDRDWRLTFMNTRAEELIKYSRSEVLGENLWERFPELIGTEFEDQYRGATETGKTASFEAYFEPLDLWTEVKAYPSEEGLAVYFRSINERKQAEQVLQATLAELERSNRELQDFAFVASHDLQEPLRKIQTFGDRLMRKPEHFGDRERDYLERMHSAAGRMQTLIMDLLSYSRVSTRAQPFRECDLNRITDEVRQDLESATSTSGAHIEVSPLPRLHGDPSQLRQVMQNLLSNAIKFRRPGVNPRILVYAENVSAKGWTLVVQDNGTGFDPKYADRLFQPFQRLHNKNEYAGTGIGLAIVRKIVDRHHGSILADGRPGEGSTFRIQLTGFSPEHIQAPEATQP